MLLAELELCYISAGVAAAGVVVVTSAVVDTLTLTRTKIFIIVLLTNSIIYQMDPAARAGVAA